MLSSVLSSALGRWATTRPQARAVHAVAACGTLPPGQRSPAGAHLARHRHHGGVKLQAELQLAHRLACSSGMEHLVARVMAGVRATRGNPQISACRSAPLLRAPARGDEGATMACTSRRSMTCKPQGSTEHPWWVAGRMEHKATGARPQPAAPAFLVFRRADASCFAQIWFRQCLPGCQAAWTLAPPPAG